MQLRSYWASIGGKMNPGQPALIRAAIERMPEGAVIIAATDNDPDGRVLADEIETIMKATGRADLTFKADLPEGEGSDWNERLKSCLTHPAPGPLFGREGNRIFPFEHGQQGRER